LGFGCLGQRPNPQSPIPIYINIKKIKFIIINNIFINIIKYIICKKDILSFNINYNEIIITNNKFINLNFSLIIYYL
jgi:hypothetical protein